MIIYPPGAGGNHLKNILCLDPSFVNSSDLDIQRIYYDSEESRIGEVPARPGRNIHEWMFDEIHSCYDRDYLLACHFGEIAPYLDRIQNIEKRILLLTIDSDIDRRILNKRQIRLGQNIHPYWLEEELPYLYQPRMYQTYFGIDIQHIMSIPIQDFWSQTLLEHTVIDRINSFLRKNIPKTSAQELHNRWQSINYFS